MSVAINSINFPDPVLRNYVKNTLAGGRSTLTDDMLIGTECSSENPLRLINLGIKDITGIDLLFVPNLSAYPVFIDISYNNVTDIDVHALYQKIKRDVHLSFNHQFVNFAGNEVTEVVNQTYPYRINLGKYLSSPASKIRFVSYVGVDNNQINHDYQFSGNVLMLKENPRKLDYALDNFGSASGNSPSEWVFLYRDPFIDTRKNNVKRKRGEPCSIQYEVSTIYTISSVDDTQIKNVMTTLPVTWSISKGELPPGLSLNPSTGLISGTPT